MGFKNKPSAARYIFTFLSTEIAASPTWKSHTSFLNLCNSSCLQYIAWYRI